MTTRLALSAVLGVMAIGAVALGVFSTRTCEPGTVYRIGYMVVIGCPAGFR